MKWVFSDVDWPGNGWLPGVEVVIGNGDVSYFGAVGYVFAVDSTGTLLWKQKVGPHGWSLSTGAVGADNSLYFAANVNLVRLSSSGSQDWSIDLGLTTWAAPLIGGAGTVYVGSDDHHLYSVLSSGEIAWTFKVNDMIRASPSASTDGPILIGSFDHTVRKVSLVGDELWSFVASGPIRAPVLNGPDDQQYVLSSAGGEVPELGRIYAFGRDAWEYIPEGKQFIGYFDSMALAASGVIYHSRQCIEAISANGKQIWEFDDGTGVDDKSALPGCTPAAIGADGTIYVAQARARCTKPAGKTQPACHNDLYALNPDGSVKWHWQTPDKPTVGFALAPPVLGANGTLYVLSTEGYLYAFAD